MVFSLFTGILLIIVGFLVLCRVTPLTIKVIALILVVISLVLYLLYALIISHSMDVHAIHVAVYMLTIYGMSILYSSSGKLKRLHWAPLSIVGFFVLLITVDTFFVSIAENGINYSMLSVFLPDSIANKNSTFNYPGKVVHDYRQKGELYNDYIKRIETQTKHGWHIKKGWSEVPVENKPAIFKVQILDKNNLPISNADISGLFIRYSNSKLDKPFVMKNAANGFYTVELSLPKPGRWGLVLKIKAGNIAYELNATTSVKKHGK